MLQVPLGVILYNENKGNEMIQIVSHLYQYVPAVEHTVDVLIPSKTESVTQQHVQFHHILLGDDQLSYEHVNIDEKPLNLY